MAKRKKAASNQANMVESIADALVGSTGVKASDLSESTGLKHQALRNLLKKMEALGIVYRQGSTRSTTWHLG